jgi:ABC-2 type transport system permease protein
VGALLTSNGRALWNGAWNRGRTRRVAVICGVALGALLWVAAIPVVAVFLRGSLQASPHRLLTTVTGGLVLLSGFTLVTSVSFAVASAYFAKDIEWLLTVPISSRGTLAHRLASQLVLGVGVGAALLGPVLVAAAAVTGTLPLLPIAVIGLVALLASPVAVGLLLVVVAVRIVPASRVRDGAAALVCLVGFGLAALDIAGHAQGQGLRWAGAVNSLGSGWLNSVWFPPAWAARVVTMTWRGDAIGAFMWLAPLLLLAAFIGAAVLWITGPLHREGWARAQLAPPLRRRASASWRRVPPMVALLRKDGRNLRRDPVQLSQLILPLALFAVYLLAPQSGASSRTLFQNFPLWYGPLTTSTFASLFVASGIGLRAVGTEGRQFWCLRSAPLGARDLLLGKLALPTLLAVGAGLVLMWSGEIRLHVPLPQMGFSAILLVLCVAGLTALATGMGAIWPRLDWSDPRRATGIWLSVVFLVLGSTYIATCMVALTVPLVITQLGTLGSDLAAIAACALCAGIAAAVALRLGYARLLRIEL